MFCPNCGAQNADDNTFCQSCGNPLTAAQPQQPEQPVYQQPEQPTFQQPEQPTFQQPKQPAFQQPQQPTFQQPQQPAFQQPQQPTFQQPQQQAYPQAPQYPQQRPMPQRPNPANIPFARKVNWIALAGGILMFISIFLPFVSASASAFGYSTSASMSLVQLTQYAGWMAVFWVLLAIDGLAAIGFSFPGLHVPLIVFGGLSIMWASITAAVAIGAAVSMGGFSYGSARAGAEAGPAVVFMIIGAVAILVGGIVGTVQKKRKGCMF